MDRGYTKVNDVFDYYSKSITDLPDPNYINKIY